MTSRPALRPAAALLTTLLCATGAAPAMAQGSAQSLLDNSWVFNLGAFIVKTDLSARLDGQSTTNPDIDFDSTFGRGSDATRIRADALWRITPTHHLRFMYFDNKLDRARVLDAPLEWGDYTFNTGSNVALEQRQRTTELAYEYAFMRQPTYEVAGTLGVHYSEISLKLSGNATVTDANGNTSNVTGAVTSKKLPAPLPVIGVRGGWVVAPQWYLDAQLQFFKVNIDGYDGNWSDFRVGGTWMFAKNFGVGLGYNRFATKVDVRRDDFSGNLKTSYSGLQAYLTGTF